eukprot:162452-Chlamydomonas_euryale.AAC.7
MQHAMRAPHQNHDPAHDGVVNRKVGRVGHVDAPHASLGYGRHRQPHHGQLTRDADGVQHDEARVAKPHRHVWHSAQLLGWIAPGPSRGHHSCCCS